MTVFVTLICSYCNKKFLRDLRHVNENKKLNQKSYCSLICLGQSKNKKIKLICENSKCKRRFQRKIGYISAHNFCSSSCAAKINNIKFPKKHALIKICLTCKIEFKSNNKYCSKSCKYKSQATPAEQIIRLIKEFFKQNGRIPLKSEFFYSTAARNRFGTWNKAIEAAGFTPNPILFSNKHTAKDGHKCDSLTEKIIDDWMYSKNMLHERNIPYGQNNMTADFKIGNNFVEFFGLEGQLKSYDKLIERKEHLWKIKKLKVIKIYPKDLFPKNKLNEVFAKINL